MQYLTYETRVTEYLPKEIPEKYLPLIAEAKNQTEKAYAVYSHFQVGSALLLDNGMMVTGNNQENSALCRENSHFLCQFSISGFGRVDDGNCSFFKRKIFV